MRDWQNLNYLHWSGGVTKQKFVSFIHFVFTGGLLFIAVLIKFSKWKANFHFLKDCKQHFDLIFTQKDEFWNDEFTWRMREDGETKPINMLFKMDQTNIWGKLMRYVYCNYKSWNQSWKFNIKMFPINLFEI